MRARLFAAATLAVVLLAGQAQAQCVAGCAATTTGTAGTSLGQGTTGTAANSLTLQGVAGGTPLPITDDAAGDLAGIRTNTGSNATAANQATELARLQSILAALGSPEQAGAIKPVTFTGTSNEQTTSATLAAGAATTNLTTDTGGVTTPYTSYNVAAVSPTAATLSVYRSSDGSSYVLAAPAVTLSAGVPVIYSYPIISRFYQVNVVNSTAAQASPTTLSTSTNIGR